MWGSSIGVLLVGVLAEKPGSLDVSSAVLGGWRGSLMKAAPQVVLRPIQAACTADTGLQKGLHS